MNNKITWNKIYTDFKQRHPRLCKEVTHWCPHDYLMIELWFKDGSRATYDYWSHMVKFTDLK